MMEWALVDERGILTPEFSNAHSMFAKKLSMVSMVNMEQNLRKTGEKEISYRMRRETEKQKYENGKNHERK